MWDHQALYPEELWSCACSGAWGNCSCIRDRVSQGVWSHTCDNASVTCEEALSQNSTENL
jgi:hypothetical protein